MYIEQLYTGCLSEAAYYIESDGEAAVIDPLRDVDPYLQLANGRKASIRYIFETHFHADFVSGHLDLANATGAPIIYGPETETQLPVTVARDGDVFRLGEVTIEVLHTPGHTMESTCYLLREKDGKPHALFTGDTLFIGDVGRPDLAQVGSGITAQQLAGILYDSLHRKIMTLPDDVIVYPAHGAGSNCGKNLGSETVSTIAEQKQTNYALQPQTREEFIEAVTEGLTEPPQYFPINAQINKEGYDSLNLVLEKALEPLSVATFRKSMEDAIILDTRPASIFTEGLVPGSINIGLDGRFAEWAGSLLPFDKPILLITEAGNEKESAIRLARVGFHDMRGFLHGGLTAWKDAGEEVDLIIDVEPEELLMDLTYDRNVLVLDVRREAEFAEGHLRGATNFPLSEMIDPQQLSRIDDDQLNIYIHCASGYRSTIAASLLKREGFHNLRNVTGGWDKIQSLANVDIVREKSVLN